ncbi:MULTISPECIES: TetR/AcrR family transcriptional regulator [Amycolatopsis]|uniref:TetR family transcriptional regulator n=1 Tax=Amycolatopsis thermoflava TaxID=84480 RepID=A0A3N2H6C5_9PSEU|nr:TetR family transcriptional regulator [Amycolatopsis thermoflava]ROS44456.1 TetR family transcriptional regulator [Amycolatopsis thermoflava]
MAQGRQPQDELRGRMRGSTDARAQRTRKRLVNAFQELAAEGGADVTVKEIVTRAGVNRTSFYAHFPDLDALAVAATSDLFDVVAVADAASRPGDPAQASLDSLRAVIEYLAERATVYERLLGSGATPFFTAVEDAFTERNRHTLRGVRDLPPEVDVDVTARYVAAGVMGVIAQWLRDGRPVSAEALAVRLRDVLPPYLIAR